MIIQGTRQWESPVWKSLENEMVVKDFPTHGSKRRGPKDKRQPRYMAQDLHTWEERAIRGLLKVT